MERNLYKKLLLWKNDKKRKPLLLQGARQVGKTFLINEFGKKAYKNYVYLNFEQNVELKKIFSENLNPHKIIEDIGLYLGRNIEFKNTLIFFDEIQVCPEAITSLKYFYEQANEFHVISAGSLLGVSVGKESSFPVGKVNFMTLHPLSFNEYLIAQSEILLVEKLEKKTSFDQIIDPIHEKLHKYYKMFLFLGGMPEVVQDYINEKNVVSARKIQEEILEAYERDFSKYTNKIQAIKTSELWKSIPYQLARENKKFKFSSVQKKARASTFEQTIEWLKKAGLIQIANQISVPKLPLSGYADNLKFKIYALDTGLLGAMLEIPSSIIISPSQLFTEYNGAFIENYVANELIKSNEKNLFYWTSKSDAEVDFILNINQKLIPLEVKSGTSRNLKSIRSYAGKYNPEYICRTSPRNFAQDGDFRNIPLYAISGFKNFLE